jgi:hypothetical protein
MMLLLYGMQQYEEYSIPLLYPFTMSPPPSITMTTAHLLENANPPTSCHAIYFEFSFSSSLTNAACLGMLLACLPAIIIINQDHNQQQTTKSEASSKYKEQDRRIQYHIDSIFFFPPKLTT